MSLIRVASLLGLLGSVSGCYTIKLGKYASVAFEGDLSVSSGMRDEYKEDPEPINPDDFRPAVGSMAVSTDKHTMTVSGNFTLTLRQQFSDHLYIGLTSDYLSLYTKSGLPGGSFGGVQTIRTSTLHWWNDVTSEDVVIRRSPSIGLVIGLAFLPPREEPKTSFIGILEKQTEIIQYAFSVRHYKLDVQEYAGIDCVDCQNTSYVKSTKKISSGAAWRHTLQVGSEKMRLSLWFEFVGAVQVTVGAGVTGTMPFFGDPQ